MACAIFDIPAGEGQDEVIDLLTKGAELLLCDIAVFLERWGNSRPVSLHAWSGDTGGTPAENNELRNAIEAFGRLAVHGEFLETYWPGATAPKR